LVLLSNTTGASNTALGEHALYGNTTGSNNTALGNFALDSNTTGSDNTANGVDALLNNTIGSYNTAVGIAALLSNSTGIKNTALGNYALYSNTSGSYNIAIGQNVEEASSTGNQQLNIGNLLYGTGIYNGSSPSSAAVIGGKIGIGTSTPVSTLTVNGSGCFSVGAGATLQCGTTAGNIYYTAANTGNYDVAENYPSGNTIAPATVVGLNAAVPGSVGVASSSMPLLGVVSTAPGMLLGGADGTVAKQTQTAVALSGRVPVSVSAANGAIAVGDRLVLSSTTPGVAVKAVHSGETIGVALSAFSGPGIGKVSVFVSSQYWFAPQDLSINPTSGAVDIGGGTTTPNSALTVNGAASASSFTVPVGTQQSFTLGTTTLSANLPSAVLTADGKSVDLYKLASYNLSQVQQLALNQKTLTARVNDLAIRLTELENGSIAMATSTSGTSFFSTTTLVNALNSLGVMVEKGIAQFGSVVANQFVAATDSAGQSSAGTVTITASSTTAVVQNAYVKPTTKIFVTFNADVHGSWWVSNKQNGSFTVSLSQAQGQAVTFDYFLVQTQGQIATSSPEGIFPNTAGSTSSAQSSTTSSGTGPVITLLGANPMHVLVGAPFSDPGYTVADSIDGTDPVTTYVNGNQQVVSSATISTAAPATYIITYSAVDSAGNRTSVTRSVIIGNPDGTVSTGSTSTSGTSSASGSTSTTGGSTKTTTTTTTSTSTKTPATTSATATTTTAVKDTTAPVVTLNGAAAMQVTQGGTFTDPGATATDNVDGNLTSKIVETGKVDTSTVGLYTLTYSATDAAGNTGSVSRVVSVVAPAPSTSTTASSTPSTASSTPAS